MRAVDGEDKTIDLLNDAWSGPRDDVPAAIWQVVALAATSAGDVPGVALALSTISWQEAHSGLASTPYFLQ